MDKFTRLETPNKIQPKNTCCARCKSCGFNLLDICMWIGIVVAAIIAVIVAIAVLIVAGYYTVGALNPDTNTDTRLLLGFICGLLEAAVAALIIVGIYKLVRKLIECRKSTEIEMATIKNHITDTFESV